MKKTLLLSAALMLCTALALSQDTQPSGSSAAQTGATASTSSSDQNSNMANGNTIQGCLTGSTGHYMLTDATGVAYQLTGDESQLSSNANKQVEVTGNMGATASASASNSPDNNAAGDNTGSTGTSASASTGSSTSATANANAAKTLEVTSIHKVADSCGSNQ
jgi:hypothetical protein